MFDQEDAERIAGADQEVIDRRRRLLEEWVSWRASVEEDLEEERTILHVPKNLVEELLKAKTDEIASGEEEKVVEEIVEEVLEESEEIVQ